MSLTIWAKVAVEFTKVFRTKTVQNFWQQCDCLGNSDWYLIYCVIYLYLTWKSKKARVQSERMQQKSFLTRASKGVFYIKLLKEWVWNLSTNADNSWKCLMYGNWAIVAKSRGTRAWNPDKLYHWASRFFSQFASMSGCWRQPITHTGSSKAQIITLETSKLSVFYFVCFVTFWYRFAWVVSAINLIIQCYS